MVKINLILLILEQLYISKIKLEVLIKSAPIQRFRKYKLSNTWQNCKFFYNFVEIFKLHQYLQIYFIDINVN